MTTKKATNQVPDSKTVFTGEYFYAVGRRKNAVAQIRLYKRSDNKKLAHTVNGKSLGDYFPTVRAQKIFLAPLEESGMTNEFIVSAVLTGGGTTGQVEAARHGIARALVLYDDAIRSTLKAAGYLRRDPRMVERKKPGLKKARRATQWRKR